MRIAAVVSRLETGADLQAKPIELLRSHSADWYFGIVRGIDERSVNPNHVRKSSGSETRSKATSPTRRGPRRELCAWRTTSERVREGAAVRTPSQAKIKFGDFRQLEMQAAIDDHGRHNSNASSSVAQLLSQRGHRYR